MTGRLGYVALANRRASSVVSESSCPSHGLHPGQSQCPSPESESSIEPGPRDSSYPSRRATVRVTGSDRASRRIRVIHRIRVIYRIRVLSHIRVFYRFRVISRMRGASSAPCLPSFVVSASAAPFIRVIAFEAAAGWECGACLLSESRCREDAAAAGVRGRGGGGGGDCRCGCAEGWQARAHERERDRDRQREREIDRDTKTQRQRERKRDKKRETDRPRRWPVCDQSVTSP